MSTAPTLDYHALAPEIVLAVVVCVVLVADLFLEETRKWITASMAGFGLLAAFIPILTLAVDEGPARSMFGGVRRRRLLARVEGAVPPVGYVVVLLSQQYVEDGDYYEGEYYFLLLSSILGMVMMASSRDLVSIFVALEFLSIPAYMLAGLAEARQQEQRSGNQVLPPRGVRLGRDALRHVVAVRRNRHDRPRRHQRQFADRWISSASVLAIIFVLIEPGVRRSRRCRSTSGLPDT